MKLNIPVKQLLIDQVTSLQLSRTETIAFILVMCWVIASCFVPIPEVNSLGL